MSNLHSHQSSRISPGVNLAEAILLCTKFAIYDEWVTTILVDIVEFRLPDLSLDELLVLISVCADENMETSFVRSGIQPLIAEIASGRRESSSGSVVDWTLWISVLAAMADGNIINATAARMALDQLFGRVLELDGSQLILILEAMGRMKFSHSRFVNQVIRLLPLLHVGDGDMTSIIHALLELEPSAADADWMRRFQKFRTATVLV